MTTTATAGLLVGTPANAVVGDEVQYGQHPFAVKIEIGERGRICSGALVDPWWVLTAASCFAEDAQQGFKIPAGAPKQKASVSGEGPDWRLRAAEISELVPHKDRDLVMARVNTNGWFKPPMDLPVDSSPLTVATSAPTKGEELRVSGFGRTKDEWVPERMHSATFTVDEVRGGAFSLAAKSPASASICQGDAGSPAFREKDGRYELVGINTASSLGGCFGSDTTGTGATETRVDDVKSWIQQTESAFMAKNITKTVTTADFNGDGRPDFAAVLGNRNLYALFTGPDGKLEGYRPLWRQDASWNPQKIVGGDFNGDGVADIAAITADGSLRLYAGTKDGQLREPVDMWKDKTWDGMPHIARFRADGSGRDGLLAVTKDGSLYAYSTDSNGVLLDQRREMWQDKTWSKKLITTGDFNGDGRDDIAAIANNGAMQLYRGNAAGRFDSGTSMWSDNTWDTYRAIMGGDFNRDGRSDIAAINGAGELYLYPSKADGTLDGRSAMLSTLS
ncbi:FG-GAP-like repeat-containing protein [Streptomyces ehimensis]|uniref:FG-GAP-like repeat-containing protein n=1 Tax=Streptomyces ehimensis TaxID=68195 RepID=A0ABV9BCA1_9ACTN